MLHELEHKSLPFDDVDGIERCLRPLNVFDIAQLRSVLSKLAAQRDAIDKSWTFEQAYCDDKLFKHLCNEVVRICKLELDWLSLDHFRSLIFATDQFPYGAIAEFYFATDIMALKKDEPTKEGGNHYNSTDLIAGLWTIVGSIEETLSVCRSFDPDTLTQLLKARLDAEQNAQSSPGDKMKAKAMADIKAMQKEALNAATTD